MYSSDMLLDTITLPKCSVLEQHSNCKACQKPHTQKVRFEENSTVKSSSNVFYCTLTIKLQSFHGNFLLGYFLTYSHACRAFKEKWHPQGRLNLEYSPFPFSPPFLPPPLLPFLCSLSPVFQESLTNPLTHTQNILTMTLLWEKKITCQYSWWTDAKTPNKILTIEFNSMLKK